MLGWKLSYTLHRVWCRKRQIKPVIQKSEGGFLHSLDNGHLKTVSFWNISLKDSGTNHALSKLLRKVCLRDLRSS